MPLTTFIIWKLLFTKITYSKFKENCKENCNLTSRVKNSVLTNIQSKLINKEAATDNMTMDCIILDGASIVNMIKPTGVTTFQEYATQNFTSYIKKQLQRSERVDIVWDVYIENSLKSSARHKRGNNINWKSARVSTIIIIKKN